MSHCGISAERLPGCRYTRCWARIERVSLRTSVLLACHGGGVLSEEAAEMKAAGWAAYKIHPPAEDIHEDIEVCKAVRERGRR